jgi:hypothetical protein
VTAAASTTAKIVAAIADERERGLFGFCVYCGHPCHGLACGSHRDLLHLDPNQYAMRLRSTAPAVQEGARP